MAQVVAPQTASVLPTDATPNDYLESKVTPQTTGAGVGSALVGAGDSLAQTVDVTQQLNNETKATDISTGYFVGVGQAKADYFNLKGQAAVDGQDAYTQKLFKLRDDALASATNPMLKQQLASQLQRQTSYALLEIAPFAKKQAEVASVASSESRADQMVNNAVGNRNDPNQVAFSAASGAAEIQKQAEILGWDKDTVAAKTATYNGKLYSTVIGTLAQDNPVQANNLYQSVKGSMDGASQERVAEFLKPKMLTYQSQADVNAITGGNDSTLRIPPQYQAAVTSASKSSGVPENVIAATIQHESGWNPDQVSSTGAAGLGQMLKSTAQQPGFGMQPVDYESLKGAAGATNSINATASYLAARGKAAGVTDWTDPNQIKKATGAYYSGAPGATARYANNVTALATGRPQDATPTFQAPDVNAWRQQAKDAANGDPELEARNLAGVNAKYQQWESSTATARTSLGKTINDTGAALLDGRTDVAIPEQQIRTLYPHDQADDIVSQMQEQQQAGLVVNQVRLASPDQLADLRSQLSVGVGPTEGTAKSGAAGGDTGTTDVQDYALKSRQLARFDAVVAQRNSQIQADPAAYVQQSPGVQALRAISKANPQDPSAAQNYASAVLSEQARLGVPEANRSVLSKADAAATVQQLVSGDPATTNVTSQLNSMETQYGALYPQVFHSLVTQGKLDPDYAVLGSMNTPEQLPAQADMQRMLNLKSAKGGIEALKSTAKPADIKDIDSNLSPALDAFRASTSLQSGGVDLFNHVQNSVKNLAYYYSATGAAKDGKTALDMAVTGVLDNKYKFNGRMRAPIDVADQFDDVSANTQRSLKADDLATDYAARFGLADNDKTSYLQAAQNGTWIPNAKDDGGVLMGRFGNTFLPIKRKDGSQVSISFNDVRNGTAGPAVSTQTAEQLDPGDLNMTP